MKKNLLLAFAFALTGTFALAQESTTPKDPAQQNDPAAQTKPDDKSNTPAQDTTGAQSRNTESDSKTADSSSKDAAEGQSKIEGQSKTKASNHALTQQLHDKFAADPALANVRFHVSKGVVTLVGKVDSAEQVTHAKEVAMSVDGVKTVHNRLKVASTSAAAASDTHADTTAEQKGTTPDLKPNVAGNQGVENNSTGSPGKDASSTNPQIAAGGNNSTTPTTNASGGTVPSNSGSIAGNTAAASGTQSGTLPAGDQSASSFNNDSASLQSTIQDKLKSEPMLSSSSVNVNVTDATIELSGTVATGKEKQTAERIAQSYAGNRKLVNRITVSGGNGNSSSSSSGQATPVQPDKSAPTSANPSSTNGNPPTNQTPATPEQSTQPK
ncbi:MAG: BON domain-containing protein [Terriglobales bacterium]|jgi:osmotically-inducible protein OsmY